ncbi:MAG: hypothetical protein K0Q95_2570 [Bacteroidota bacterium]|nr:hypothetical protein [Bacteroidota bacterium]
MKRNRIAIILVILLGALSFWFIINNRRSTIKETLRDFAVKDTAAVDKIFLADKLGNAVTLERSSGNNNWTVNGKYIARSDAMQTLLVTITKLDIKEPVGKKAQDNIVKQLAAGAVRCEIYSKGDLVKAYYVGTQTQDMTGTYMILMDPETMKPSAKPFITYIPGFEGYLTTRYFTEEKMWRDRTIYQYVPNDIAAVKLEVPDHSEMGYELKINGNNDYEVTMLSGKKISDIDPLAVKQYLSYFQQVNFESLDMGMSEKEIDSTLKSTPINILSVTDKKGTTKRMKFFARKPKHEGALDEKGETLKYDLDRMNALLDWTNDFVMVQYYVFGKMMPPADYFVKKSASATEKPKS